MSTARKSQKRKSESKSFDQAFDAAIEEALAAEPKDIKVHISLRLDSDIYMELQRRADLGEGNGKYQKLLNQLLRQVLFSEDEGIKESNATRAIREIWEKLDRAGLELKTKTTPIDKDARTLMRKQPQVFQATASHSRAGKKR